MNINQPTQPQLTPAGEQAVMRWMRLTLLGCNDHMPRVTTIYAADTELELERIAAFVNARNPLAFRMGAAIEAGKLAERPLVEIQNTFRAQMAEAHATDPRIFKGTPAQFFDKAAADLAKHDEECAAQQQAKAEVAI